MEGMLKIIGNLFLGLGTVIAFCLGLILLGALIVLGIVLLPILLPIGLVVLFFSFVAVLLYFIGREGRRLFR